MKRKYIMLASIALCLAGCQNEAERLGLTDNPAKCRDLIMVKVPVGTPVADAERIMKEYGFACNLYRGAEANAVQGGDMLHCDLMSKQKGMVSRRWQVMFILNNDKVEDVRVTTGLVGT